MESNVEVNGHIESSYPMASGKWTPLKFVASPYVLIHGLAPGLNYGQQAYEGLKAFRMPGRVGGIAVFRPDRNAARLQHSAQVVSIPPVPTDMFLRACRAAVAVTPIVPDSKCAIDSITSDSVQQIGRSFGWTVEKRPIKYTELPYFCEVVGTGTAVGLVPIRSITRRRTGHGELAAGPRRGRMYPDAHVVLRELNLGQLDAVFAFADFVDGEIARGALPPLTSIVCNAFYWNLVRPLEMTRDGFEKTMQINHVAHAALVLRMLRRFAPTGRIVLLSSDAHRPGQNKLEKMAPSLPDNLERLVKPEPDGSDDHLAYGFHRYANSKLAVTAWGLALSRHLQKDPALQNMTVVVLNPGSLSDSRALRVNTPGKLVLMSRFLLLAPMRPLLRLLMDPTMRTAAEAGTDVARLATSEALPGEQGFLTLLDRDESSDESRDQAKQEALWKATARWGDRDVEVEQVAAVLVALRQVPGLFERMAHEGRQDGIDDDVKPLEDPEQPRCSAKPLDGLCEDAAIEEHDGDMTGYAHADATMPCQTEPVGQSPMSLSSDQGRRHRTRWTRASATLHAVPQVCAHQEQQH
ncbi:hypothetical protein HIM_08944 [Hirsutella minnesotensis 3608]|uniref:Uncharacterized protein n=1 Tax=Hirsutella minnesotensis 3608 TaxID=1043627 RepID=A0A0F7ZY05_9HYPO|nr:hypothetical protein HIM_08944 [Hirsutella minnesotensis 3608]